MFYWAHFITRLQTQCIIFGGGRWVILSKHKHSQKKILIFSRCAGWMTARWMKLQVSETSCWTVDKIDLKKTNHYIKRKVVFRSMSVLPCGDAVLCSCTNLTWRVLMWCTWKTNVVLRRHYCVRRRQNDPQLSADQRTRNPFHALCFCSSPFLWTPSLLYHTSLSGLY